MALPADGHGNDDWLPTRVEQFSGGWDLPGYQHPQWAHGHKGCTHQRVGIVIKFCIGAKHEKHDMSHLSEIMYRETSLPIIFYYHIIITIKYYLKY